MTASNPVDGQLLGKGSFGSVYVHVDLETNKVLAVKKVDLGLVTSDKLNEEVKALCRQILSMRELNHDQLLLYIGTEVRLSTLYIYMGYMSGGSVRDELITHGALCEDRAKIYTTQILKGLSYLHSKEIIHGAVKASNIFVDGMEIKLSDFGVSKYVGDIHTLKGEANGDENSMSTVYWMAPEVIRGENYGSKADIWSTGSTVWEMLTTHPPRHQMDPFIAMFDIASLTETSEVLDSEISRDVKHFLAQTFTLEEKRPTADELRQHSWLNLQAADVSIGNRGKMRFAAAESVPEVSKYKSPAITDLEMATAVSIIRIAEELQESNPSTATRLDDLVDGKLLGKGSFGSVHTHCNTETNKICAVKKVDLGLVPSYRLTQEVVALSDQIVTLKVLNHEQLVSFFRTEVQLDVLHIYMEYMPGGSVKDELTTHGALNEDRAKIYTVQILKGLSYLHKNGITHGAVKASNILFDGKDHIKLSDFGVSKHVGCIQTLKGETNGDTDSMSTVYWMAPEVVQGENVTSKADTWSTGATVVEMLRTHPPWYELEQMQAMFKIASLQKGGYALDSKISRDAEDFLSQTFMLEEQRPRADELLKHSWLKAVYVLESEEKAGSETADLLSDVQKHDVPESEEETDAEAMDSLSDVQKHDDSKVGLKYIKPIDMATSSVFLMEDKYLGSGVYGSVYLHYDKRTNAMVAVKRIDFGTVASKDANITKKLNSMYRKIYRMEKLSHKRLVQYIRGGRKSKIFSIYMEYMCGGSVKDELYKNGALSEDTTRKYTHQILEGLSYLHGKRLIHRDVKGSNVLCDGRGNIKLADFGISKQMNEFHTLKSIAGENTAEKGSLYWTSPEVIQAAKYRIKADIWSTGATVVEMLTTHPPWYELEHFQAMFKIVSLEKGGYHLDSKITRDAKDFLTQTFMLEEQRPRADELLKHSWLKAAYVLESEEKAGSETDDLLSDVQKHNVSNVELKTLKHQMDPPMAEVEKRSRLKDEQERQASFNVEKTTPVELDVRPKIVKHEESHESSEPSASSEGSDIGSERDLHDSDQMDTSP